MFYINKADSKGYILASTPQSVCAKPKHPDEMQKKKKHKITRMFGP